MKNLYKLAAFAFACCCILAINLPTTAQAPTPLPNVWLQPTSPGTAQTGNINIYGKYVSNVVQDNMTAISINLFGTDTIGVRAVALGANGRGVYGQGTACGVFGDSYVVGVYGSSPGFGIGVKGSSPSGIGVKGESNFSYGVHGVCYADDTGLAGVYGSSGGGNIAHGVHGVTNHPNAYGVFGVNPSGVGVRGTSSASYGVVGITSAGNSAGVRGENTGTASGCDGVFGVTSSSNAAGVSGSNNSSGIGTFGYSASGYGVQGNAGGFAGVVGFGSVNGLYGLTGNSGASGVYGVNNSTGWGVYGVSSASGTGVAGVNNDPAGYGVYCQGRLATTGAKLFQIDHPFDPENKYLNHFCTEGAEPLNAYSGKVTTDDKGYATVALPDYFTEINRDPRIQLTVIDDSDDFVVAKVLREPTGAEFTLRTSKPNVKVYWRVEAVRNDRWVRTHGFEAEETKPPQNRGKYLNPELYGQPKTKGQFYVAEPGVRRK